MFRLLRPIVARYSGAGVSAKEFDAFLVPTAPLAVLIRTFFAAWNRDRPPTGGRFAAGGTTTDVTPIRASAWLSTESGISESTIRNIVDERYRMTELRIADALVSDGFGHPEYLYDGTLEIVARAEVATYLVETAAARVGITADDFRAIQALALSTARASIVSI